MVHSDDGIHFRDMRIVQGELPIQRYAGKFRSIGPQYTRGISHWADDGSRAGERAMWLVYSMSKEDVWVSRVPRPIAPDETQWIEADDWERWNVYCPKWADVEVIDGRLRLSDRDPYDYASATRVFPAAPAVEVSFEIVPQQNDRGRLEIDLTGGIGSPRAVRIALTSEGTILITDGDQTRAIGSYTREQKLGFHVHVSDGKFDVSVNNERRIERAAFAQPAESLSRITFRTGEYRNIGGSHPVAPGTDVPHELSAFEIGQVYIKRRQ